jgi:fructose transport system permease protein
VSGATQAPASYDAAEEFLQRRTPAQRVQTTLHRYPWLSPAIVLILSGIVFGIINEKFATPNNLSLITQQVAVVGALAVGQTLIILTAGIDLSCGAIMVFSSMVMAKTAFDHGIPGWLAILLGLVVGGLAGAANGLLVTRVRLPPFIVTLGTWNIFTAFTLLYATGRTIRDAELANGLAWLGETFSVGQVRLRASLHRVGAARLRRRRRRRLGPPGRHPGTAGAAQRLHRGRRHLRDHGLDPDWPGQCR